MSTNVTTHPTDEPPTCGEILVGLVYQLGIGNSTSGPVRRSDEIQAGDNAALSSSIEFAKSVREIVNCLVAKGVMINTSGTAFNLTSSAPIPETIPSTSLTTQRTTSNITPITTTESVILATSTISPTSAPSRAITISSTGFPSSSTIAVESRPTISAANVEQQHQEGHSITLGLALGLGLPLFLITVFVASFSAYMIGRMHGSSRRTRCTGGPASPETGLIQELFAGDSNGGHSRHTSAQLARSETRGGRSLTTRNSRATLNVIE